MFDVLLFLLNLYEVLAKMAKQEKGEVKKEVKVEAKENLSIASVYQKLGKIGAKSRKDLAEKIIAYLKGKEITVNSKGKTIRIERVSQQISAMTRDINKKRGEKTGAWWSKLTVEESDKEYKLVPKQGMPQ